MPDPLDSKTTNLAGDRYPDIKHSYDIWHVAKNMAMALVKVFMYCTISSGLCRLGIIQLCFSNIYKFILLSPHFLVNLAVFLYFQFSQCNMYMVKCMIREKINFMYF